MADGDDRSRGGPWDRRPADFDSLKNFGNLQPPVRAHVSRVYRHLAQMMGVAAAAGVVDARSSMLSLLHQPLVAVIAILVCMYQTLGTEATPLTARRRWWFSFAYAVIMGVSLTPLVQTALWIDPSVVLSAIVVAGLVFGSFSFMALRAPSRSLLYLGGMLGAASLVLVALPLVNALVFQSRAFDMATPLLGTIVFSGYVAYDTQLMVYHAENGDRDVVGHAMRLFLDLGNLFVDILTLLMRNSDQGSSPRRRRRQR